MGAEEIADPGLFAWRRAKELVCVLFEMSGPIASPMLAPVATPIPPWMVPFEDSDSDSDQ